MRGSLFTALGLGASLALGGCAIPQGAGGAGFQPVAFDALPGWQSGQMSSALAAFVASCRRIQYFPTDQSLGGSGLSASLGGKAGLWGPVCAAAKAAPPDNAVAARHVFETYFQPYRISADGRSEAKITGYYEPEVAGSTVPGGRYTAPVLSLPPDLVTFDLGAFDPAKQGETAVGRLAGRRILPYYDRFQIENGALDTAALAIAWLADPVDAYFLQIEGSGLIDLPDGSRMRVTYAGKNGLPYVPIGRVMLRQGLLAPGDVTEQSIRAWLEAHPGRARAIMDANPSYIFFQTDASAPVTGGPPGALGVALTAGHSLAVDRRFIPLGAPVWLTTTDPVSHAPLDRMTVAQDIGSAIVGPLRADLFFGDGAAAAARAGAMDAAGQLYVLLPRPSAAPSGPTLALPES